MGDIKELLEEYRDVKTALYGLGTETGRFLSEFGDGMSVAGLMDGFRENGTMYGYPILPIAEIPSKGVGLILVVARPGSCKAITRRIGAFCLEHKIALYDVRGRNLLEEKKVSYDFKHHKGRTLQELLDGIDRADVVSFDLFDTLVARKVRFYTDVFELLDWRLQERGICIPDFSRMRLSAEKELSRDQAPGLRQIYEEVLKRTGGNFITAPELALMEWETDLSVMAARESVCEVFCRAAASGKPVVVTTDSYYSLEQIQKILDRFGLTGCDKVLVSCEYGISKTQGLFRALQGGYEGKRILHIGDDEVSDIGAAETDGLDTYRVLSGEDLFDTLGGLGIESELSTIADRVKAGMFLSRMFNSPFWFEEEERTLSVSDVFWAGYLFCGPVITDFVLWLKERMDTQKFGQILFCARDGYLIGKLFRIISPETKSIYFLTSRTAAVRAGVEDEKDIAYVDEMKYFGTAEESLKTRFGIQGEALKRMERSREILVKAKFQRGSYQTYIKKLGLQEGAVALFDFVAKGTVQMYLQKLFVQHMKGFYFLQLEPEFMADKGLDIQPFYLEEEKNTSAIFDHYYILETILTSPYPQMEEFDEEGNPRFAAETRSEQDIRCFERAQNGIVSYFEDYLRILPKGARQENKKLGGAFLSLMNQVQIEDGDFLGLKVEDPFFGRMTDIKDIIDDYQMGGKGV
jgi:FMN phosphatase YigB (HAD superfamily)